MRRQALPAFILLFLSVGVLEEARSDAPQVAVALGEWRESRMGDYPRHENHPTTAIEFRLHTGQVDFGLRYHVCVDKSHAPDVAIPEGYLGMFLPSAGNWYHNGFLFAIVNGRDIGQSRVKTIRVAETGERGMVELIFPIPEGEARVTFLVLPGDDRLFVRAGVLPQGTADIKTFAVRAMCYPSGYIKQGDRWVSTAERSARQGTKLDLNVDKEWWCAYYDKQYDPGKGQGEGSAALLFLPEEVACARVEIGSYGIPTTLEARPGVKSLRLIFWDFKGQPNEKAIGYLRARAEQSRDLLKRMSFENRNLDPAVFQKRLSEARTLAAGLPNRAAEEARVNQLQQDIEAAQKEIVKALAAGAIPPASDEDRLLENSKRLDQLLWDLRFKALFAD